MDRSRSNPHAQSRVERQVAHLKIVSRLLSHELHAQNSPRITLSRDEVQEIQTSIDLFIEEVQRGARTASGAAAREIDVQAVTARVN